MMHVSRNNGSFSDFFSKLVHSQISVAMPAAVYIPLLENKLSLHPQIYRYLLDPSPMPTDIFKGTMDGRVFYFNFNNRW